MVDRRKGMHRTISETPPRIGATFLSAAIPYASEVERMGVKREPVVAYDHSSKAAQCYEALWEEVKQQLG
jgi:hypothetical protein